MKLISKLKRFQKKEENKELVFDSATVLLVRILGAGAAFIMNVIIARYLGVSEAGYFFLAYTIVAIVSTIARIGADNVVLRFVSIYTQKNDWVNVNAILNTIIKWSATPILIISVIICIFSKQISITIFHKSALALPLFWAALSMPSALYNIYAMALQGKKKTLLSITTIKILTPLFLIILIFIFAPRNSTSVAIYYTIASFLNLVVGYYWWKKNSVAVKGAVNLSAFDKSLLWKSCLPLWIAATMQQMVIWGGQFIAGIYNTPAELSQLAVARNTAVLIAFILTAVNYVAAPRFAIMYNEGKMEQLKIYAANTSKLIIAIALPLTVGVLVFPDFIMSIFGKGFADGSSLLRVLAVGQFINVCTGSVGYLLMMSGHEKDMRNISIANGIMAIVLALILNPVYGVMGSAISTAIAVASTNLMAVAAVKKRLGFNTLSIFGFKTKK